MPTAVITGSSGLIGSEAARYFSTQGLRIVGIDNDMRSYFFGKEASTRWNKKNLQKEIKGYVHKDLDVRDIKGLERLYKEYSTDIKLVIHTAAQPSHDWAAREPLTDFGINANGTLNFLEMTRRHCPQAVLFLPVPTKCTVTCLILYRWSKNRCAGNFLKAILFMRVLMNP